MALAVLFSFVLMSAGFAVLRTLRVAKGALGLGLAPAAGLAVLSVEATWCALLNVPPPVAGIVLACVAAAGLGLAIVDRGALGLAARTLWSEQRSAAIVLAVALAATGLATGVAFGQSQVPLSPHDGAFHAQVIQAHRTGPGTWANWYPPGLSSLFAAMLELLPWLDSATGTLDLGLALPLMAVVTVFGLAVVVWRDLLTGSATALLLSFTYVYPYFPELWTGLPLALSLILVMAQWTVGIEYVARANWRLAVFGGLLLGSIVLVHGTELWTLAAVWLIVLASVRGRLDWPKLVRHAGLAAGVAVVCAAPYLPTLLAWAGSGGAYAVGIEDGQVPAAVAGENASVPAEPDPFVVFALGALGVDLPIRLALLAVGLVWAFRVRRGRAVVAVGVLFAAITSTFTLLSGISVVHEVYAVTFPWGMDYRVFMVVAIAQVLLAGAGLVAAARWLEQGASAPTARARRVRRAARLLGLTWLGLMTWATTVFLAYPAGRALGYSADDAVAMTWLRQHASPGDVLANDGYADAGIWAPYKAGVEVVLPRILLSTDAPARQLVLDNIAQLDQIPEARAVACALNVAYVYHGARASDWDARRFPALPTLRASPALAEVFSSGDAVVFQTRLACPG